MSEDIWTIVLAGGDGKRLESASIGRYGYARPKQYCDFDGRGTLLDRTLARAAAITEDDRIVVVTTRAHRREADEVLSRWPVVARVEQPRNADTTAGIILPLLHVLAQDPGATVVVFPSDHQVRDEAAFLREAARAAAVASTRECLVLLGAEPDGPEDDYGWIVPGRAAPAGDCPVESFREKPPSDEIDSLLDSGALLNTFVLAAPAYRLVDLVATYAPVVWTLLSGAWGSAEALERAYDELPRSNFSRDVLERAQNLRVLPVAAGWSDIGTPYRLRREVMHGAVSA
jgi:mannose-1-phosphate guanylyltransferase